MRIGIRRVKLTFAAVAMAVVALTALAACGTEPEAPARIVIIQSSTAAPMPTPIVASHDRDALMALYNAADVVN